MLRLIGRRTGGARALLAGAAALGLAACGAGDNDPGPGGVTVGEARALDEAAEMLDQRRPPDPPLPAARASPAATESEARAGAEGAR